MNPFILKALVAGFHKKTATDLTINSVDLFLVALNNATKNALLGHNFEMSRVTATLDIDGTTGGSLDSAVISGSVNETLTVTSTAAAGTYLRTGGFGGYPLYVLEGATSYFLYFNAAAASYVIATTLTTGALTDFWLPATDLTEPVGSYVGQGAAAGTAVVTVATSAAWPSLKEVVAVQRVQADGSHVPLDFSRADIPIERDRTSRELADYYDARERYPSDADILNNGDNTAIIQRRRSLFVYPPQLNTATGDPLSVRLEAYAWLPTFDAVGGVNATAPNFLFEHGADWLQWEIILELNYYFQTFVPRQEGVLAPPIQARDTAWRNLLLWDSYMVDSNTNRSR